MPTELTRLWTLAQLEQIVPPTSLRVFSPPKGLTALHMTKYIMGGPSNEVHPMRYIL